MKIGQKHFDSIFQGQNDLTSGTSSKRVRATSAAPALRQGDGKNDLKLVFNAKDKNQLKQIQNALKLEQQSKTTDVLPDARPSGLTGVDTGVTASGAEDSTNGRFRSGQGTDQQSIAAVSLTNQTHKDDRQSLNQFNYN
jgi:hypothetical protein